jgi:hypothetical protein
MIISRFKRHLKKTLPPAVLTRIKKLRSRFRSASFGDLNRLTPIVSHFGLDRGTPVDRYYLESFLAKESDCIRDTCLR